MNLLNFVDRYVASAVKEPVKAELGLTDTETALPQTAMAVAFIVFALFFGAVVDRQLVDRRKVILLGVGVWSLATMAAGFAQNLRQLVFFRALIGVGEASYGVIAGPMLSDFFPPRERMMVFAFYNLSGPVGGALGFGAGGVLASMFGWRASFMVVGGPGLLAAVAALTLCNPVRGLNDAPAAETSAAAADAAASRGGFAADMWRIVTNPHYSVSSCGLIAILFVIGGLSDWVASFLYRYDGAKLSTAGLMIGAVTALAGIAGNLLGAKATDFLDGRVRNAPFFVPAMFCMPAAVGIMAAVNVTGSSAVACIFVLFAQTCLWTYMSPMQNLCLTVTPAALRSRAVALQIFLTHILGDVISPPIIGAISDRTGSLQTGMQITWAMLLVASMWWFIGCFYLSPIRLNSDASASENAEERSSFCELFLSDEAAIALARCRSSIDLSEDSESGGSTSADGSAESGSVSSDPM